MDHVTGLELIKLLLQVVYADDVVTTEERTLIDAVATRVAGEPGLALIRDVIDGGSRLPPPNMGLLSAHRSAVLREVARLGAVDGIHKDELDLVAVIGGMLR